MKRSVKMRPICAEDVVVRRGGSAGIGADFFER
jgi:hypothetical protein